MSNYVTDEILLEINKRFLKMYEDDLNFKIKDLNFQNNLKKTDYVRMKVTVEELLDILHKINVTKLLVKKLEENVKVND